MRTYYVDIMANQKSGTLYVGVTNDLVRRVYEHKHGKPDGFTKKYGVDKLVWFKASNDNRTAIQREKSMKHWRRAWKITLIESLNPDWCDLHDGLSR